MEIFSEKTYGEVISFTSNVNNITASNVNIIAYKCGKTQEGFIFRDDYAKGDEICYIPDIAFGKKENRYKGKKDTITREAAEAYGYTFNQLKEFVRSNIPFHLNDNLLETLTRELLYQFDWGLPKLYIAACEGLISLVAPREHTCPNCGHHFKD